MYSVKPGRGPSFMGVVGAIIGVIFGVFWLSGVASFGAPPVFVLFGILFIVVAIISGAVSFYNAVSRNRFSTFDVTTDDEESDPIAQALDLEPRRRETESPPDRVDGRRFEGEYCPYCGAKVERDFDFCPKCGKDI